jgi:hypothetical protein
MPGTFEKSNREEMAAFEALMAKLAALEDALRLTPSLELMGKYMELSSQVSMCRRRRPRPR